MSGSWLCLHRAQQPPGGGDGMGGRGEHAEQPAPSMQKQDNGRLE